jgi:serine phosphatase RsbU (regulator of sigma subunit)
VITADCTGHGLSGAFMSVLAITLLNQIVKEQRISQPLLILEKLRDELYNALLSTEENIDKDEIDIAIIEIDKELATLKYVGANMPVVFVKNDEFYIEKGNRRTLSGSGEGQVTYEEKIHQYDSGDVIYMFSDGWQDQFGGEENKKFMFKRLQNLIFRVYELPLQEQKKVINSTIDNWMINADQIDDILMLGIRL